MSFSKFGKLYKIKQCNKEHKKTTRKIKLWGKFSRTQNGNKSRKIEIEIIYYSFTYLYIFSVNYQVAAIGI